MNKIFDTITLQVVNLEMLDRNVKKYIHSSNLKYCDFCLLLKVIDI